MYLRYIKIIKIHMSFRLGMVWLLNRFHSIERINFFRSLRGGDLKTKELINFYRAGCFVGMYIRSSMTHQIKVQTSSLAFYAQFNTEGEAKGEKLCIFTIHIILKIQSNLSFWTCQDIHMNVNPRERKRFIQSFTCMAKRQKTGNQV